MLRRFEQPSFSLLGDMETLLIESCKGMKRNPSPRLCEMYSRDINIDHLIIQLQTLPDFLTTAFEQCHVERKEVKTVSELAALFKECFFSRTMLSEVHLLIRLYLTVPVTTATAERSFSALRRLKTYLRTTMPQRRLNNMVLLHLHKERTDKLDLSEIAKNFISKNRRRTDFLVNCEVSKICLCGTLSLSLSPLSIYHSAAVWHPKL
eukprot:m.288913 g.288913  ORF g.288913 m.288913 type:complete len:207 (+) comp40709_c0_seq7:2098-2718(+)